jgi:hypothetical protein
MNGLRIALRLRQDVLGTERELLGFHNPYNPPVCATGVIRRSELCRILFNGVPIRAARGFPENGTTFQPAAASMPSMSCFLVANSDLGGAPFWGGSTFIIGLNPCTGRVLNSTYLLRSRPDVHRWLFLFEISCFEGCDSPSAQFGELFSCCS